MCPTPDKANAGRLARLHYGLFKVSKKRMPVITITLPLLSVRYRYNILSFDS